MVKKKRKKMANFLFLWLMPFVLVFSGYIILNCFASFHRLAGIILISTFLWPFFFVIPFWLIGFWRIVLDSEEPLSEKIIMFFLYSIFHVFLIYSYFVAFNPFKT